MVNPQEEKPQSKSAGAIGRARTYDISPTDNYKMLNIKASDEFAEAIKMAAMLDNCTQTEFVLKALAPVVKRVIAKTSDKLTAFLKDVERD